MAQEPEAVAAVAALVTTMRGFRAVDLSPVFHTHMPQYSLHPEVQIVPDARDFEHHGYHLQTVVLPEHSGSHVDAPSHVPIDRDEQTIDTFDPLALWGRCVTVQVADRDWQPGDLLSLEDFQAARGDVPIQRGDIVLVNFGWDRHLAPDGLGRVYWGANNPGFSEELCRWLAEQDIAAAGTDHSTCDISQVDRVVVTAFGHMEWFLPRGILVLEGLNNLAALPAVSYFAALPLKIAGGSGSPVRPVALVPTAGGAE